MRRDGRKPEPHEHRDPRRTRQPAGLARAECSETFAPAELYCATSCRPAFSPSSQSSIRRGRVSELGRRRRARSRLGSHGRGRPSRDDGSHSACVLEIERQGTRSVANTGPARILQRPPGEIANLGYGIAIVPYGIRIPAKTPLSGAPVVLIVGRLEPRKGTEIALRAAGLVAASMPKARFVFAGQIGRDRQGTPYQDVVARDSRLSRAVTLMGRVDQASLERLREQSSVIMVPSLAESFGLTYLEAMAAGRALIAFDIPPARELLGGDGIPLVPPNSEALADAVLELLSDHDKCVQIAEAGWRLLLERYTVERMVANTLDVYRRIG